MIFISIFKLKKYFNQKLQKKKNKIANINHKSNSVINNNSNKPKLSEEFKKELVKKLDYEYNKKK